MARSHDGSTTRGNPTEAIRAGRARAAADATSDRTKDTRSAGWATWTEFRAAAGLNRLGADGAGTNL